MSKQILFQVFLSTLCALERPKGAGGERFKGMTPSDLKIERTPDGALLLTMAGDWKLGNIGSSHYGALAQL